MTHELLPRVHIHTESDFQEYLKRNEVVFGDEFYEYHIRIDNIGKEVFPGGRIVDIREVFSSPLEPTTQHPPVELEKIEPEEATGVTIVSEFPIEVGAAFLDFRIEANDDQEIQLYRPIEERGNVEVSIYSHQFYVIDRIQLMILDSLK